MKHQHAVRLVLLVCLAIGLSLSAAIGQTSDNKATNTNTETTAPHLLDLNYDPVTQPYPAVRVRFKEGGPSYLFLVDTGQASPFIIAPWVAREAGLYKKGTLTKGDASTGNKDTLYLPEKIRASLVDKNNKEQWAVVTHYLYVVDEKQWKDDSVNFAGFSGSIGIAAFGPLTLQFDFERKALLLYPPGEAVPYSPSALVFPIKPRKKDKLYEAHVNLGSASEPPVSLIIDTGAVDTVLPEALMPRLKPVLGPIGTLRGDRGLETHRYGLLPNIKVNGWEENNVTAFWVKAGQYRLPLLGMPFLSRFRVTLDQEKGVLSLEPAKNHDMLANALLGAAGIGFMKSDGTFFIDAQQSPLLARYNKTLQAGDQVISIDGVLLAGLSASGADHLLNYKAGTDATLVVKRNNKTLIAKVTRFSLFSTKNEAKK